MLPVRKVVQHPTDTLAAARAWLRKAARERGGTRCPCCGQHAQVYRRSINAGMARSLIAMHRLAPDGAWVHVPTQIGARSREEGKLAYWGLVEEEVAVRPDGGRSGWWRVTARGRQFAGGRLKVAKWAYVYNGMVLEYDSSVMIDIKGALGRKFDYDALMRGE